MFERYKLTMRGGCQQDDGRQPSLNEPKIADLPAWRFWFGLPFSYLPKVVSSGFAKLPVMTLGMRQTVVPALLVKYK